MKSLYIDCSMGAAGDMLTAALLELFPDKEKIVDELNAIGVPGVRFEMEKSVKCGIAGTHLLFSLYQEIIPTKLLSAYLLLHPYCSLYINFSLRISFPHVIYHMCQISCSETVINIHHRNSARTGV